jgi:hypothetical protein
MTQGKEETDMEGWTEVQDRMEMIEMNERKGFMGVKTRFTSLCCY